jgi:hypothetical protein
VKNGEVTFFVLLGLLFALGSLRDVVKAAQAKRCGRCGSDKTFNADDSYQCAECGAQLATALFDAHWGGPPHPRKSFTRAGGKCGPRGRV